MLTFHEYYLHVKSQERYELQDKICLQSMMLIKTSVVMYLLINLIPCTCVLLDFKYFSVTIFTCNYFFIWVIKYLIIGRIGPGCNIIYKTCNFPEKPMCFHMLF